MHTKNVLINIQIYTHMQLQFPKITAVFIIHVQHPFQVLPVSKHQTWPSTSLPPLSVLVARDRRRHCRLGVIHATRWETTTSDTLKNSKRELLPSSWSKESIVRLDFLVFKIYMYSSPGCLYFHLDVSPKKAETSWWNAKLSTYWVDRPTSRSQLLTNTPLEAIRSWERPNMFANFTCFRWFFV